MTEEEIRKAILEIYTGRKEYTEKEVRLIIEGVRAECIAAIRSEYETWTGSYKPVVKVALEHCIQRIDPDATL